MSNSVEASSAILLLPTPSSARLPGSVQTAAPSVSGTLIDAGCQRCASARW